MSTKSDLIEARAGTIALAEEVEITGLACKQACMSRSHFCNTKDALARTILSRSVGVPASRIVDVQPRRHA